MSLQLFINGLIAGGVYALVALGFSLLFRILHFFNFAHAAVITIAAYVAYGLNSYAHWPPLLAGSAGIAASVFGGAVMELCVFRSLRRSGNSMICLLASLGLCVAAQNVISMLAGDDVKSLFQIEQTKGWNMFGAQINWIQILILVVAFGICALVAALLNRTEVGKQMRALAEDVGLALTIGIDINRITFYAVVAASAFAGVAGVLIGMDNSFTPTIGFNLLLMGVVATVVGGVGSILGALLGGLFIGIVQNVGVWFLPTAWQDAIVFGVLIVFLMLRPQGLFGRKSVLESI
jgi:branched-chain amino acid transport system permease protein